MSEQVFRVALFQLGTDEFIRFTERAVPKCCVWRDIRKAGLDEKRWKELGIWVKTFVWEQYLKFSRQPLPEISANPMAILETAVIGVTPEEIAAMNNMLGDTMKRLLELRQGDEGPLEIIERLAKSVA